MSEHLPFAMAWWHTFGVCGVDMFGAGTAYKRFSLNKNESLDITVEIPDDAFFYYDRQMKYGMHNGDYTVSAGTSSTDIVKTFEVRIRNGLISADR